MSHPDSFRHHSCLTTLDALLRSADELEGVKKSELRTGDWVFVKTRKSLYCLAVLGKGKYRASGGWFERKGLNASTVSIAGCTWGGSAIKTDVVAACGLRLEFGNRLLTSPIQKIIVLRNQILN